MTKKDDLIAEAEAMGVELTGAETSAELQDKIDLAQSAAEAMAEPDLRRRKVSRGSRRRIERTMAALVKEIDAAIKELDRQAYMVDEDGERVAPWPLVNDLREFKAHANDQVNQLLATGK